MSDNAATDDALFEAMTPLGFRVRVSRSQWELIITVKHPVMAGRESDVIPIPFIDCRPLRPVIPAKAGIQAPAAVSCAIPWAILNWNWYKKDTGEAGRDSTQSQ